MRIYLGADHRGFDLKQALKAALAAMEYEVVDLGATAIDVQDDFVDFARLVALKVAGDPDARGILLCGSGAGMCIAANKVSGIRCAVGHTVGEVQAARSDDNINVLSLGVDYVSEDEAQKMVQAFLTTEFTPEERFVRRIAKIKELEAHA